MEGKKRYGNNGEGIIGRRPHFIYCVKADVFNILSDLSNV